MSKNSADFPDNTEDGELEYVSKTQIKQEAERLKKIGLALVDLSNGQRAKMPLDEDLREAVELATRINRKKDGFRRQLQLIGKKLRAREIAPIETALEQLRSSHSAENRHFHSLESLRDTILENGNDGINEVVAEHPQLERQKLRQLARSAQKQQKENKSPIAAREIFQYLKQEIPFNKEVS